ncbi:aldehyde dehydrogenase [Metschnikowia bicuspidata var. bicuspidata NRRL YB-4993]|uniref:Aldehyde dehydrogenase n=1 Tax=Metschnikowia bicuspidata var. bicuspidata NRRL YB-4993 TaxID=869754 RepID=A0A1A0H1Y0_9ASCO|nr:aldehyde dehydrogenase [Metschnikowia bicuspidata var. bicuspidata NRRL YB-4993]OBA17960.1 aldehyde dehydrogenase [Metschnikowia bicuspidata var. bicuspidata NRRL YB-4993]
MSLPLEYQVTLPNGRTFTQPAGLFVNNEFVKSKSGKTIESINPSTGEVNGSVYAADEEDVDEIVAVARKAFKSWKKTSGVERADLLFKLVDIMKQELELLTDIEAWDSGKTRHLNALYDVEEVIAVFKYYAGWADKVHGRVIAQNPKKLAYTLHEPYGVCAQIIPWNYPLLMAAWKLAPALAAGNVVILKSSEVTPLSILYFATLFKKAGFPPGVVNIISGLGTTAGKALASHLDVNKVAFTGSTATGRVVQKLATANLKAVTLECGGKSPLLVRADADLEQAVKWAAIGIMSNQGQICTSTSRIYVHESIYEKFLTEFSKHVTDEYKQGDMFVEDAVVGPQVSKGHFEKILSYLDIGKKEGARVVLGGEANTEGELAKGYYVKPTVFADVQPHFRIVKEEIFGPVVVVGKFSTDEEAIELANATEYGLGASIFTQDITVAHNMAADIESGQIWINSSNDSDVHIPFGGVKMSGVGRELGEYGLEMYTEAKAVHVNLGTKL